MVVVNAVLICRARKLFLDSRRPNIAKLEYLLDRGDEILYVLRRCLKVEEVVVDDRLRLRLESPTRACELKFRAMHYNIIKGESRPTRACELKYR